VACEQQWKRRKTLKVALLDEPRFIVRLREPVVANGLAGMSKTIDSIAIRPDDAGAFEQLLATPSVTA
jgi:hypothetical protein